jgi:hypothetical protein
MGTCEFLEVDGWRRLDVERQGYVYQARRLKGCGDG